MKFDLTHHLKQEHHMSQFSTHLREIVYGGNDGIVTTFAVVAGFAGAQKDPMNSAIPMVTVLLFGLANLMADGLSMSLGSFLSLRAAQDVYRNEKVKEAIEIRQNPKSEFEETVEILKLKKFSHKDAVAIASYYQKNPAYWTEFMMTDELQIPSPENENAHLIAFFTFLSFVGFGIIPLVPYFFGVAIFNTFTYSILATFLALLLLGILRAGVTRQKPLRAIGETILIGGISAFVAYFVGTFFR